MNFSNKECYFLNIIIYRSIDYVFVKYEVSGVSTTHVFGCDYSQFAFRSEKGSSPDGIGLFN
jgi:hypothetical protein